MSLGKEFAKSVLATFLGGDDGQLRYMATQLTTDTGLFGEWWQRFPPGGPGSADERHAAHLGSGPVLPVGYVRGRAASLTPR